MSDAVACALMVAALPCAFGAGWLFSASLTRLMSYHSRRLSVATLYMQWARYA